MALKIQLAASKKFEEGKKLIGFESVLSSCSNSLSAGSPRVEAGGRVE